MTLETRSAGACHAPRGTRGRALLGCVCLAALLTSCSGRQSSLDPAGREATELSSLFWWMTGGSIVVWIAVLVLAFIAVRQRSPWSDSNARWLIVLGGAVVPTLVLGVLLVFGLAMLPRHVAPAPEGSLTIQVIGERWWWRVKYLREGSPVELANEIRLPVGEPVQFLLESSNVIHAFWIPALAGKRDMIPGRVNRMSLTPTRTGLFRGVCAEYCGESHALMAFDVVVMERAEFDDWLERQSLNAAEPRTESQTRGQDLFFANGCSACHTIRGTPARGVLGPDLTHIGSRLSLGAGTLTNVAATAHRWIVETDRLKPGVLMPAFDMLDGAELEALAAYLGALE